MTTSKPGKKHLQLSDQIASDFSAMQADPDCTVDTVGNWLTDNMNNMAKVFTGEAWGKLHSYCTVTMTLMDTEEGDKALRVVGDWDYAKKQGPLPKLETIAKHLPAIRMQDHTSTTFTPTLCAILSFNFDEWPGLVPVALEHFTRRATSDLIVESARAMDRYNIQELLSRFYPHVKYDFLMTAVELGILEPGSKEFVPWLNSSAHTLPPAPPASVPEFNVD